MAISYGRHCLHRSLVCQVYNLDISSVFRIQKLDQIASSAISSSDQTRCESPSAFAGGNPERLMGAPKFTAHEMPGVLYTCRLSDP